MAEVRSEIATEGETSDWQHLTAEARAAARQRLEELLPLLESGALDAPATRALVASLHALAVDVLVQDAHRAYVAAHREIGFPNTRDGAAWANHLARAQQHAAAQTARFRQEILRHLRHEETNASQEVITATVDWWIHTKTGVRPASVDRLVVRCADQVAALLMFQNLASAVRQNSNQTWWLILARRTVERVLLPQVRSVPAADAAETRTGLTGTAFESREPADTYNERVSEYLAAVLAAAPSFHFQGVAAAVSFFVKACHLADRKRSPEPQTVPLPQSERMAPAGEVASALLLPSVADQLGDTLDQQEFEEAWPQRLNAVLQASLGNQEALVFWVLFRLRHDGQEWKAIAELALRERCGILTAQDLPPDIAPSQADAVFALIEAHFRAQAMKARKAPKRLTGEALRKWYSVRMKLVVASLQAPGDPGTH